MCYLLCFIQRSMCIKFVHCIYCAIHVRSALELFPAVYSVQAIPASLWNFCTIMIWTMNLTKNLHMYNFWSIAIYNSCLEFSKSMWMCLMILNCYWIIFFPLVEWLCTCICLLFERINIIYLYMFSVLFVCFTGRIKGGWIGHRLGPAPNIGLCYPSVGGARINTRPRAPRILNPTLVFHWVSGRTRKIPAENWSRFI